MENWRIFELRIGLNLTFAVQYAAFNRTGPPSLKIDIAHPRKVDPDAELPAIWRGLFDLPQIVPVANTGIIRE